MWIVNDEAVVSFPISFTLVEIERGIRGDELITEVVAVPLKELDKRHRISSEMVALH